MKQILLSALIGAVVASLTLFIGLSLVGGSASLGAIGPGVTHFQKENFIQGLSIGRLGQFDVTNAGAINASSSLTLQGVLELRSSSTFRGPFNSTGTADTVGVCGASPSIVGSNGRGVVTTGSDATSTCTITFGVAFRGAPSCVISGGTTAQKLSTSTIVTPAAATLIISQSNSSQFNAAVFNYQCFGLGR